MADVYEQNLPQKTNLTTNDYVRVVGSDDVSYKQPLSDVAQKTIENYAGSTLAGSTQSVKGAIDGLKSSATADKAELNASINEVASDLASESSTRASQDTNLQAQINQLVAPTGTAPNPAEIENARIGADNVTYTTLGGAIRTQFTNLKSELTPLYSRNITAEQGYWAIADGSPIASSTWVRSKGYIPSGYIYETQLIMIYLQAFEQSGAYVGTWDGSAFTRSYTPAGYVQYVDIDKWMQKYPSYKFKFTFYRNGVVISPSDIYSDMTVTPKMKEIANSLYSFNLDIEQGYWSIADGTPVDSSNWARTADYIQPNINIKSKIDTMLMFVQAYSVEDEYIGTWDGSTLSANFVITAGTYHVDINEWMRKYPNYKFKLIFYNAGQSLTPTIVNENIEHLNNSKAFFDEHGYITATINSNGSEHSSLADQLSVTFNEGAEVFVRFYSHLPITEVILYAIYADESVEAVLAIPYDEVVHRIIAKKNIVRLGLYVPAQSARYTLSMTVGHRGTFLSIPFTDVTPKTSPQFVYSVNHRGYSLLAPENTLPAYIMSKQMGFTYVETDVWFTSDNIPVLLHDDTINRTARNADGTQIAEAIYISDITYEQALAYDFGIFMGEEWAGTKIPTLEEFILICKKLALHPFIEFKEDGTWTDARIADLADLIKSMGMENHVTFISFAVEPLRKISALLPKATLGLGGGGFTQSTFESYLSEAITLKSDDHEVIGTVEHGYMNDNRYKAMRDAGITPIAWTINDTTTLLSLNKYIGGVLSDNLNIGDVYIDTLLATLPI